jgi:hypothetical protein
MTPATGLAKRMANIEPHRFKPGESGKARRSKRFIELHDQLTTELGDVSAVDAALLSQAVNLMVRAERVGTPVNDMVRLTNAAARLLTQLRAKYAKGAPVPSLADMGL